MKCSKAHNSVTADESNTRLTVENVRRTLHGVLNRGTSQEQPITTLEAQQSLPPSTRRVLDILRLIQNHILPFDPLEVLLILSHQLIAGNQNMEGSVLVVANLFLGPELSQSSSVFDVTPVRERFELGNETGDLLLPVVQSRCRRDDQERTPDVVGLREVGQQ